MDGIFSKLLFNQKFKPDWLRALKGDKNLRSADLSYAPLRGVDFKGADLRDAQLVGADLQGANLEGANLAGANLQGANLLNVTKWGANFNNANFADAKVYEWFFLSRAEINYVSDGSVEWASGASRKKSASFLGATLPDGSRYKQNKKVK
jgi:uncharacterized protein YjbI with pentapeptide repeats